MHRFDQILTWCEEVVMVVSYMALIFLVGLEAIRRIAFAQQAAWGPEVALFAFIWLSWFAMSNGIRRGTHLAFTEFRQKLPRIFRDALELLDCVLWLVIGAVVIYASMSVVEMNLRFNQVIFGTQVPLVVASVSIPLAWTFALLRVFQKAYWICTHDRSRSTTVAVRESV